ncbi:signal recognition particle protein [Bacteroidetes/Chlorobi group bacterium MS-B_bin-24]|jgi:signal recognition particle subunit SRP54|nr:MAG: signal recognition particle protein [Bacteroidetes/Chlorobi group bacterium MS-B_bin-24]
MFESLQEKLELALKRLKGQAVITESNIEDALREIRRALIEADVNINVAKKFVEDVKTKALGTQVKGKLLPEQVIVKIVYDELVEVLGKKLSDLVFASPPPTKILVAGLQGSGKTTFCAKLAKSLKKKGRQPLLVACDVHRPAAIEQLKQLGQQANVPVFSIPNETNAITIAREALTYARKFSRDVLIFDTAGRTTIDEDMMTEVENLAREVQPTETLFVCDAMIGQDAVTTAKAFDERLPLTGVVLTKLDGDTRGGAALSVLSVTGKPIKFISVGEKLDALEPFHPERIASRILGMGDIVTLVEKAEQEFDEQQAKKLEEKIRKNQFTFEDFWEQLKIIKKMGSLRDLLGFLPGMDKALRNVNIDEKQFARVEAIILSMTKEERQNPKILNGSRRKRIAMGSGTTIQDVNRLIKQFEDMTKLMKTVARGGKNRFLKNFNLPQGFGLQ